MELYKIEYYVGPIRQTLITTRKLKIDEILEYAERKWDFVDDEINADDIVGVSKYYDIGEYGELLWESCEY